MSANNPGWDEQQWKRPSAGGDAGPPAGFPIPPGASPASPAAGGWLPGSPSPGAPSPGSLSPGSPLPGSPAAGGSVPGDSAWSRGAMAGEPPAYTGPPRPAPGSAAARPPTVIRTAPARELPPQDIAGLDAEERQARTMTYGVGMVTGAVALLVLFVLCGRILF